MNHQNVVQTYPYSQQGITITSTGSLNVPTPSTQVREATNRLQMHNGALSESIIRLRDTVNRLVGGEPEEAAKNGPAPVPNGEIQMLHAEIESYERMLVLLAYQLNRLAGV